MQYCLAIYVPLINSSGFPEDSESLRRWSRNACTHADFRGITHAQKITSFQKGQVRMRARSSIRNVHESSRLVVPQRGTIGIRVSLNFLPRGGPWGPCPGLSWRLDIVVELLSDISICYTISVFCHTVLFAAYREASAWRRRIMRIRSAVLPEFSPICAH